MRPEIADPHGMLAIVTQQEESLRFERFTFEDAWEVGLILRNTVRMHGGNAALDVTLGGVQLFRCGVGNPTPNNSRWIQRKMNIVNENWKSSLRVMLEMNLSGRTLPEFGLSEANYALSGGCFPLWLRDQGVVGTVAVSGLPQTHDHQMVVDALATYLHVDVPSVLT